MCGTGVEARCEKECRPPFWPSPPDQSNGHARKAMRWAVAVSGIVGVGRNSSWVLSSTVSTTDPLALRCNSADPTLALERAMLRATQLPGD
jgi:hypothetical protein